MDAVTPEHERSQVEAMLRKINDAWLNGPPEAIPQVLSPCLAEDTIIRGPDFRAVGRGKEACIESYVDFARQGYDT